MKSHVSRSVNPCCHAKARLRVLGRQEPHRIRHLRAGGLALLVALIAMLWWGLTAPAQAVAIERWQTETGLTVLFAPAPSLPMLDLQLTFAAGSSRDDAAHGLARLTSDLLTQGAGDWDADALAERLERVGAQLSTSSARDMGIISLRTLTEADWLDSALETLVTVLAQPQFTAEDLERVRRNILQDLQRERQEPGTVASRRFFELLYAGHPYSNPPNGRETTLAELTPEQVRAFYQRYYSAGNGTLAITGALSSEAAHELADRIAEALPAGPAAPTLPPVPVRTEAVTERIAFPSEQVHILLGAPILRQGDPAYFPLTVGNHVLGGGGFTSRLFREVRSQRGLAYSVFSAVRPMAAEGPFMVNMQTGLDNLDEAITVLREQLLDFHEHGVTAEELEAAQANISGGFPLRQASNRDIVRTLGVMGFYDFPLDYLSTYVEYVEAVTREQVQQTWQDYWRPDTLITVIVGGETG